MTTVEGTETPFCYITTRGRRTGRDHTIEIWFGAAGRTVYILTEARERSDTVRNARANGHARVRIGDRDHTAEPRVLDAGTDEDALARRLLLAKYQSPGAHDPEEWGAHALAVAFDLGDGLPSG